MERELQTQRDRSVCVPEVRCEKEKKGGGVDKSIKFV